MEKKELESELVVVKNEDDPMDEMDMLVPNLPQERSREGGRLCLYSNNFWTWVKFLRPILNSQKYFKAHDTDIIISTLPKSGTTWLKALTYSIVNRNNYSINQSPLLISNPHDLVPRLEFQINQEDLINVENTNSAGPRIFSTHVPYHLFSNSIHKSKCKVIYICRNPLDHFTSLRPFLLENEFENDGEPPLSLDESFDMFCRGIYPYGPFWEHVLGYWNANLRNPDKLLFLKYEDLQQDVVLYVKKIAEFIGLGFSEEEDDVIKGIVQLCTFENMKNLEVNKTGIFSGNIIEVKNCSFFRKGQVGDWANYLTPEMKEKFDKIIEAKLQGSGLKFKYSAKDI
ncbi:hypothetical protein RD792_012979 [Penstemon davidsonii]|uniref:Sulfotransferase n=1 Tax=Penstemon davidsonii TaxID=160366 RepID=A0ABR0CSQ8_9LAMI|nr:hypothetical protein RD792_012979 [Penstemon davidsonii]